MKDWCIYGITLKTKDLTICDKTNIKEVYILNLVYEDIILNGRYYI